MTSRFHKPGGKKAKLEAEAERQATSVNSTTVEPGVPARIEIGRQPEHITFDLRALEHPLCFSPRLSIEDYQYLREFLLFPEGGVIRMTLFPDGDGEERSYFLEMSQSSSCAPKSAYLVLHLLEVDGQEHISFFYRSIAQQGFQLFATRFASDGDTWESSQLENNRLLAAAESWALQRQRDAKIQENLSS